MASVHKVLSTLNEIIQANSKSTPVASANNVTIENDHVSFEVILNHEGIALRESLMAQMESRVKKLDNVHQVSIKFKENPTHPLKNIKQIIAISSCKGGVGKSTIAVHIARTFAQNGFKVGLVDADIYGPSIPTLLNISNASIKTNQHNKFIPVEKEGMKIMSFGFLLGNAPAIMRGPIVTRYIQHILFNTAWGDLDYLFIDMPPGTGDVHLTVTQTVALSGSIIVTTPHTLSLIDVARGILMYETVAVPIIGIIENMSYFSDDTNKKHYVFGQPSAQKLQKSFGIQTLGEIPILREISQVGSKLPETPEIKQLTQNIIERMDELKESTFTPPEIKNDEQNITLHWKNGEKWQVNNRILRLNSQDALSIDEMTGKSLINEQDIRPDIKPKKITPLGNYALGIEWNDGHTAGIYTYELIKDLSL